VSATEPAAIDLTGALQQPFCTLLWVGSPTAVLYLLFGRVVLKLHGPPTNLPMDSYAGAEVHFQTENKIPIRSVTAEESDTLCVRYTIVGGWCC
jgi:hypothetical protein